VSLVDSASPEPGLAKQGPLLRPTTRASRPAVEFRVDSDVTGSVHPGGVGMDRRSFIKTMSLGAVSLAAAAGDDAKGGPVMSATTDETGSELGYKHRIAFGAWANDMRNSALPLQQWPAPQFDDKTVEGLTQVLEVIGDAGYGYLDTFGLYGTNDYPVDIVSAFGDRERNRRLDRVFREADKRGIRMSLPLGLLTWGWDTIIREDPEVRGKDGDGNPHPHAMCGAREKSWVYVDKLIDTMFERQDFGAVHMESADLGYCMCPECSGKDGPVGYNARLNMRAGDYIKSSHPDALVYVCPINWVPWGLNADGVQHKVSAEDMPHIVELSRHIDVFMDQGHRGRMIDWSHVGRLRCDYGTSGGLWVYHGARQDRLSYFLPYPVRAAQHLRDHYEHGARACLYYQGPMVNPAVEVTSAVAGRVMRDPSAEPMSVLEEVVEHYYRPRTAGACQALVQVFAEAEEAYFGQWDEARFKEVHKAEMPGEFTLGVLFGTQPDPAAFLTEPFLDAAGRAVCKTGLVSALGHLMALDGQFEDRGRIERMTHCLTIMLHLLTTVMLAKGEDWAS